MNISADFIRGNRRISVISNSGRPFRLPAHWQPLPPECAMLVAIPDMHMYVHETNLDNFKYGAPAMLSFLDHLADLKEELRAQGSVLRIYQIGDLYEQRFPVPLSRAPNVTSEQITASHPSYSQIIDTLKRLRTHFIYGNHDFEMRHFPDFHFAAVEGKIHLEHGFMPDPWHTFANPRAPLWEPSMFIFKGIREIEDFFGLLAVKTGLIEKDAHFAIGMPSGEEERGDYPAEADYAKRQFDYYTQRLLRGANGREVRLSIIGHTHHPYFNPTIGNGEYLFIDAGCWTSGRSDFVVITNEEVAICRYGRQEPPA